MNNKNEEFGYGFPKEKEDVLVEINCMFTFWVNKKHSKVKISLMPVEYIINCLRILDKCDIDLKCEVSGVSLSDYVQSWNKKFLIELKKRKI